MNQLSLRIYILLVTVVSWLQAFAQNDDGSGVTSRRGMEEDQGAIEDIAVSPSFNLEFTDILIVLLVAVSAYIFNKIWKGCTYLIIISAAIIYFASH